MGLPGIKTVRESGTPQWVRITVTTDEADSRSENRFIMDEGFALRVAEKGTYISPRWHFGELLVVHTS